MMPKVSIIIPTFNRACCIAEAIGSVLNQTYAFTEIIVIDDGSTDNTREAISRYKNRITLLEQNNAGPAKARNRGIRASSGELIAFLDSDDLWMPGKIERQVAEFTRNSAMGIVATNVIFRYPDREARSSFTEMDTDAIRDRYLEDFLMVTSSVMIRRKCLEQVGLFNESLCYAEDLDLFYRVARKYNARILAEHLTVNRRGPDRNLMTDTAIAKRERLVSDTVKCFETMFAYPENSTKIKEQRNRYRTFYRWIGLSDLYNNPGFARKYLRKALSYKPWDYSLYLPFLKSFLLGKGSYSLFRKAGKILRENGAIR